MRLGSLNERQTDLLLRAGALAGAATLLGVAARRNTAGAWTGAAVVALPLAARGVTGQWPLENTLKNVTVEVSTRLAIERPPEEVFDAWRRLEELPQILRHVESVEQLEGGRSRWRARTPAGAVEWRAELVEERRPEVLRWSSLPGSQIEHQGRLALSPGRDGRSTMLELSMRIGGEGRTGNGSNGARARAAVAALVRPALALEIREDLRRFKNRLEAGEVPTTAGQPSGDRARLEPTNPA